MFMLLCFYKSVFTESQSVTDKCFINHYTSLNCKGHKNTNSTFGVKQLPLCDYSTINNTQSSNKKYINNINRYCGIFKLHNLAF